MRKLMSSTMAAVIGLGVSAAVPATARANERHFTYTYESAVLPKGAKEMEVWSTFRTGRNNFYSRMDHRLEYEVGLTDRLQTSFYLNFHDIAEEDTSVSPSVVNREFEW